MPEDLSVILNAKLQTIQSKNPSFSARSFSRHLGITPGYLSEVLRGKKMTYRQFSKVLSSTLFTAEERRELARSFDPALGDLFR